MAFKLEIRGADKVAKRLSKPLTRLMEKNFDKASKIYLRSIQQATPKKTGDLARSQSVKRTGKFSYAVTEGKFYGAILRKGSPPHIILPRRKQALWWPGIIGGKPVARVSHPGFNRRPYFASGVKRAKPEITRLTGQFGEAIMKQISK